ncbi:MAG: PAS domain S-box protein [Candidatus Omnitrophica bacterium]|nr:PAS domain S-box protein [Candidatus Omnitrophota bacterium]
MKIGIKLILGFLIVVFLLAVVGYVATNISRRALEKNIGKSSAVLARTTLGKIDRDIFNKIQAFREIFFDPNFQKSLRDSNKEFSKIEDFPSYVKEHEKLWDKIGQGEMPLFISDSLENPLAQLLRNRLLFYSGEYGYPVFGEAFITNRYGVNIAQTSMTTDYYQADENWWIQAKEKGLFVEDVNFDASSNMNAINFCLRINDVNGDFLGVLKVVFNLDGVFDIIDSVKQAEIEPTIGFLDLQIAIPDFQLFTRNGELIYPFKTHFLKTVQGQSSFSSFERFLSDYPRYFVIKEKDQETKLVAYSQSRGFGDYKGLGWVLVLSFKGDEVFSDINRIKSIILIVSLIAMGLSILIGFIISDSISSRLIKLRNATSEVGKGNLDIVIQADTQDELGELAEAFNQMTINLKDVTASKNDLDREILRRERIEDALRREKDLARQYLDIAGVMMVALDIEGNIILINERGCEILGYRKEEILGQNWFDLFLPQKNAKRIKEVHARLMAGETELLRYYENSILTKRGEERNILWSNSSLKGEDGQCIGILSSGEDVTERRKSEKIISLQRDLGIMLSARHNLKNASEDLLQIMLQIEEFDSGAIYLIEKETKKPRLIIQKGFTEEFAAICENLDVSQEKVQCVLEGRAVYGLYSEVAAQLDGVRRNEGLRGVAITPVEDRGEVVAIIFLSSHFYKDISLLTRNAIEIIAARLGGVIARIRTEEDLMASEDRYRVMAEQTGQLIYDHDLVSQRVYWSGAIEKVTGYTPEEYLHVDSDEWVSHIHPDDRTEVVSRFNEKMKNLQPFDVEYRFCQKDGHYIYLEEHGVFLTDEHGVANRMIGTMSDITKRKEDEMAIKKSEEKYRELVESANSIILRMDQEGRVSFLNEFAQKFFRYKQEEILGKSVVGTIVPETDDSGQDLKRMIEEICVYPEKYAFNENQNMRKDGYRMWVAWTNKVIFTDSGTKEILCIGTEITERKEAEQKLEAMFLDLQKVHKQLKQAQQQLLQSEKMAAIGQLSAGVAHEVKNPLSIILLSVGMLEETIRDLGEEGQQHLKMIVDAAERANKVVVELLNFSRYSQMELSDISLHQALDNVVSLSRGTFKNKDVVFNTEFTDKEIVVKADKILLEQVFFNLFGNAFDAIEDKGEISIKTYITEDVQEDKKEVIVEVSDTGSGMPKEVKDKIFEPFYTTKDPGKGTGLGLSTAYMILERHGAKITVESEVGKGSKFFVTIPVSSVG